MQKSKSWIKLTLLLVGSMTIMASAIIAPALPKIKAAYAYLPQAEFLTQLVLTMPGIFIALGAPLVGRLIDRIGRKKVLIASLAVYGAAGTAGFYLDSLYWLLASRALLGLAVAGGADVIATAAAICWPSIRSSASSIVTP
ncbi:MAG: MFS transporter, partial [Bacteroidia bacterium]|nr:MFS transporter [Bacteroidia bacterium]